MWRRAVWCLALAGSAAGASAQPEPPPAVAPVPAPITAPPLNLPNGDNTTEDPTRPPPTPLDDLLKPTFRLRGLIETEAVMAAQSAQSKAVIGDLQNGYGFRRARLGAQGTIGDSARWISEIDLAGGSVQLIDVFVGLTALPGVREVRAGHFREPFSLEGATGVPAVTFLERSPLNEFDPTRNWGLAGYWWPDDERLTVAGGVFRNGTNRGGQSVGDEDAWAYTGRLTGLPVYDPDGGAFRLLHLGAAASTRSPVNGVVTFNPGNAPSLLVVVDNPPTPFLPPVEIPATDQQLYNLQAAYVAGPFSVQSEWFATVIHQPSAGPVFLHGVYGYASYFLTGEHRGYDRTRGAFAPVKVLRPVTRAGRAAGGGPGAYELAARYTFFDFTSPNLPAPTAGATGQGVLRQAEFGLNWYLNDNTRLMFTYTAAFPDVVGRPPTSAHVFGVRASLFW